MGLSLPKSNLIFLKKCLDKWVHFTLFNNKGGVSKTTTTFHLGWKLAEMGYKN